MKKQLEEYINQYGLSAVLKELDAICDEKSTTLKDRDPKAAERWYRASVKLFQLAASKFLQTL